MSITTALSIAILRFVITIFATALACILSRSQYKLKLKNNHFLTDTPIESLKPVQLQRFHQDYALKRGFPNYTGIQFHFSGVSKLASKQYFFYW